APPTDPRAGHPQRQDGSPRRCARRRGTGAAPGLKPVAYEAIARHAWVGGALMPIATPEQYADMLDAAQAGGYAFPAVNVSSSQTLSAAMRGFAEARSDGIVQLTTGGAEYASGTHVKDMALGAKAI